MFAHSSLHKRSIYHRNNTLQYMDDNLLSLDFVLLLMSHKTTLPFVGAVANWLSERKRNYVTCIQVYMYITVQYFRQPNMAHSGSELTSESDYTSTHCNMGLGQQTICN